MKLNGLRGLTLFQQFSLLSDEPRYQGKRFENKRLAKALEGQALYELEIPRGDEHTYEEGLFPRLIELYIPVLREGSIVGVVEMYRDAVPILGHIRRTRLTIWLISILGGLTIYLSMQVIVRRASLDLLRMQRELKVYSEGLEQKVQERTQQLEAANLSLMAASQHKSEFLAHMSHELRTPLNSVLGFSEVLEDGMVGPLNDKQRRYVQNIHEGGKHLLALLNDILI